jgi:hypothetical protein
MRIVRTAALFVISLVALFPAVAFANFPPGARVASQVAYIGSTVILDGSGSADPERAPLSYRWAFTQKPPGSAAAISDAQASRPKPNSRKEKKGNLSVTS